MCFRNEAAQDLHRSLNAVFEASAAAAGRSSSRSREESAPTTQISLQHGASRSAWKVTISYTIRTTRQRPRLSRLNTRSSQPPTVPRCRERRAAGTAVPALVIAEPWVDHLRDCARCGMCTPAFAVGDGALGFWKALAEVFLKAAIKGARPTKSPMLRTPYQSSSRPPRRRPCRRYTRRGARPCAKGRDLVRQDLWRDAPQGRQEDPSRVSLPSGCGTKSPGASAARPPWPWSSISSSPPSSGGRP